jgi:hypothetical protein
MLVDPKFTYLQAAKGDQLAYDEECFYQILDETRDNVDRDYIMLLAHKACLASYLSEKTPELEELEHGIRIPWFWCTHPECQFHIR